MKSQVDLIRWVYNINMNLHKSIIIYNITDIKIIEISTLKFLVKSIKLTAN